MFLVCSRVRASPCANARPHGLLWDLITDYEGVESVDEIRRKLYARTEAQKFRQQMSQPDRIVGRAFAELEEEKRRKLEWKQRMGYLSEKERKDLEREQQEKLELGLDPKKGRWSEFLKNKRFTPKEKKGMPEFRAGAPMQSLLAKVKHAKTMKQSKFKKKK